MLWLSTLHSVLHVWRQKVHHTVLHDQSGQSEQDTVSDLRRQRLQPVSLQLQTDQQSQIPDPRRQRGDAVIPQRQHLQLLTGEQLLGETLEGIKGHREELQTLKHADLRGQR